MSEPKTHEERADACQEGRVEIVDGRRVAWIWTPQIGGYVAPARVTLATDEDLAVGEKLGIYDPCFDAEIFHDGEFPSDTSIELHACGADQWLRFGAQLAKLNGLDEDDAIAFVREAFASQRFEPT